MLTHGVYIYTICKYIESDPLSRTVSVKCIFKDQVSTSL